MSDTSNDPLVDRLRDENRPPERPHYALGTLLGPDDFRDEQLYHRGRLARALASLFGAGTVAGLKIGARRGEDDDELTVEPGLALDVFGRLIEVQQRRCIRLRRWFDAEAPTDRQGKLSGAIQGDRAIAWLFLRFRPCEAGRTPVIAEGPFDATNATAPARIRDVHELRLFFHGASDQPKFARSTTALLQPAHRDPLPAPSPTSDARLDALKDAILTGWGAPPPTDADWVLLGRIDIPVARAVDGTYHYAVDLSTAPPVLDNHLRPFVFGAWALAHEADLPLPARATSST